MSVSHLEGLFAGINNANIEETGILENTNRVPSCYPSLKQVVYCAFQR